MIPAVLLLALLSPFEWTPSGPERGSVTAISAAGPMLAGTAEGRVFRKVAGGWQLTGSYSGPIHEIINHGPNTWIHAGRNLYRSGIQVASGVNDFAVAPANSNLIHVARDGDILDTADAGSTWR